MNYSHKISLPIAAETSAEEDAMSAHLRARAAASYPDRLWHPRYNLYALPGNYGDDERTPRLDHEMPHLDRRQRRDGHHPHGPMPRWTSVDALHFGAPWLDAPLVADWPEIASLIEDGEQAQTVPDPSNMSLEDITWLTTAELASLPKKGGARQDIHPYLKRLAHDLPPVRDPQSDRRQYNRPRFPGHRVSVESLNVPDGELQAKGREATPKWVRVRDTAGAVWRVLLAEPRAERVDALADPMTAPGSTTPLPGTRCNLWTNRRGTEDEAQEHRSRQAESARALEVCFAELLALVPAENRLVYDALNNLATDRRTGRAWRQLTQMSQDTGDFHYRLWHRGVSLTNRQLANLNLEQADEAEERGEHQGCSILDRCQL